MGLVDNTNTNFNGVDHAGFDSLACSCTGTSNSTNYRFSPQIEKPMVAAKYYYTRDHLGSVVYMVLFVVAISWCIDSFV
jgi:hypothetical protein